MANIVLRDPSIPLHTQCMRWSLSSTADYPPECCYGTKCALQFVKFRFSVEKQSILVGFEILTITSHHSCSHRMFRCCRSVVITDRIYQSRPGFGFKSALWLSSKAPINPICVSSSQHHRSDGACLYNPSLPGKPHSHYEAAKTIINL